MMAPEPLRSATSVGNAEDTSLALPSDNKLRTGQQRVLDQVFSIKRSKSKQGKNGLPRQSRLELKEVETFAFPPTKANGIFLRSSSTMSTGFNKVAKAQKSRTLSARTFGSRNTNTSSAWEQNFHSSTWPEPPNRLKPSRSDPALAPQVSPAPAPVMRPKGQTVQGQQTTRNQITRQSTYSITNSNISNSQARIVRPPSDQSHNDNKVTTFKTTKTEQQTAAKSGIPISELSLKEAVEFLSHPDENYQQCGATFIQHTTFKEEQAKQEVFSLGGIPPLVLLLRSPNPVVSQSASGALRNLVFKDHSNKLEVQRCGGIAKALQLLKETDSTETQKQITGLLWNLSSSDELKEELIATALPVLTESVVVPFTCWSDSSANNNIHPDVFYNATGCLRNLSCAHQKERNSMRECRGLIDSLMSYVQSCVAEDNPDDKSVENCACILHNFTYQLESESPECFAKYNPPPKQNSSGSKKNLKSPTVGCFSPKSSKAQKQFSFDVNRGMPEDRSPSGVNWLCHSKAMQTYLSLLGSSQNDATLEACCGALQNLTASKELGSNAMSQILVQKLGALQYLSPLLHSPKSSLQKTTMSLVGNLSRTSSLQSSIAKQLLPELTSLLSSGTREMGNSDETVASTCNTVRSLMLADTEVSKKLLTTELVSSVADLSENGTFTKGSKAASLLLYSLWNDKSLQGALKKLGMGKSLFVNDNTTAVHKSLQVVE
ncbi:hypothetical protein LDENG_00098810 [Lucifuga dentata]|nr:hypothetical protein LDENG_00098810 [Lucifuga dentata]